MHANKPVEKILPLSLEASEKTYNRVTINGEPILLEESREDSIIDEVFDVKSGTKRTNTGRSYE